MSDTDYFPQSEAGAGEQIDLTADTVYLLEHDLRLYGTALDPVIIRSLTEGTKAYIDCNGFKIYSATGGVTLEDVEIINGAIQAFPSTGRARHFGLDLSMRL